jgi:hypothetical protein
MASYLLPQGTPLSMPQMAPTTPAALPKTGAAESGALNGWLVLIAALGLIAGGWLLRRWGRQHD